MFNCRIGIMTMKEKNCSPFDFRNIFGEEAATFKQLTLVVNGAEQQVLHRQSFQHQPHDLAHVHAGYHLLHAASRERERGEVYLTCVHSFFLPPSNRRKMRRAIWDESYCHIASGKLATDYTQLRGGWERGGWERVT